MRRFLGSEVCVPVFSRSSQHTQFLTCVCVKQLFVLQTTPSHRGCSGWPRDRDSTSTAPSPASHTGTRLWDGAEPPGHPWGDGGRGMVRGRRGHEQPGTVDYIHPDRCWQLGKGRSEVMCGAFPSFPGNLIKAKALLQAQIDSARLYQAPFSVSMEAPPS